MSGLQGRVRGDGMQAIRQEEKDTAARLVASAVITDLPDKAFFGAFTARRRREMLYHVRAAAPGIEVVLEVHGSGSVKAVVTMAAMVVEDGGVEGYEEPHAVSWARSGEEAVVQTRLDHRHLESVPGAGDVMAAWLDAIGTHTKAVCAGGYQQWRATMSLLVQRAARERGSPVEAVAVLPLPAAQTDAGVRLATTVEIFDVADPDHPVAVRDYEAELAEIDEAMTPEAMSMILVPPGLLVCRWHREIFSAG